MHSGGKTSNRNSFRAVLQLDKFTKKSNTKKPVRLFISVEAKVHGGLMSGIILMETEQVRSMARQLEQVSLDIESRVSDVLTLIRRLDWQGASRDVFVNDAQKIIQSIITQSTQGLDLSRRVDREVTEWESQDQSADYGSISPSPILIGAVIIGGTIIVGPILGRIAKEWNKWWWSQTLQGLSSDEAYQRIMDILDNSPIGRQAIEDAKRLGLKYLLAPAGSGTYFDPPDTIYIDPTLQQDMASDAFIHELEHAKQNAEHLLPDPRSVTQEEFIQKTIGCEADAVIKEFLYEQQNGILNAQSNPPYEQSFWNTVNEKIAELQKVTPPMSKEAINEMAMQAGRQDLIDAYMRGDITTSTTHQSYVDYYGNAWTDSNKK